MLFESPERSTQVIFKTARLQNIPGTGMLGERRAPAMAASVSASLNVLSKFTRVGASLAAFSAVMVRSCLISLSLKP